MLPRLRGKDGIKLKRCDFPMIQFHIHSPFNSRSPMCSDPGIDIVSSVVEFVV